MSSELSVELQFPLVPWVDDNKNFIGPFDFI